MTTIGHGEHRSRADIQGLRGYAVLVVVLFHANLGVAQSGFLGVDVFFVISGYLIAGIIMRDLAEARFSFQDFYLRRVRRLFPAAFATLALTTVGALFLLTPSGWDRFVQQLYGSLVFATNVVLWKQINYFHPAAEFEPLLHMWSLAVEEQYYLLLPLVLAVLPKRWWRPAIVLLTLGSVAGFVWLYPRSPGAAFYLLPTRAWEIGIGAAATFFAWPGAARRGRRIVAGLGAGLLLALPLIVSSGAADPLLALLATLATAAILAADAAPSGIAAAGIRPLRWLGDRSYSLYLLHWPLFALAHNVQLSDELPVALSLALIATTVVAAAIQYRWVEEPIRRSAMPSRTLWLLLIGGTAALAMAGAAGTAYQARVRPALDLAGVNGLPMPACDVAETPFRGRCAQSAAPTMLVWGDSLSQAITPALDASSAAPIVQASMGQCAPLPGLAPVDRDATPGFARACLAHNRSVLAYAIRTPSIAVVVMTGSYLRYAQSGTLALADAHDAVPTRPTTALLAAAQARAVGALRAAGKRVVVIAPPPQAAFDIGQCWERALRGLPTRSRYRGCVIAAEDRHPDTAAAAATLSAFARAGTPVIRLDRLLCPGQPCRTARGGTVLYRDGMHLSRTGATLIGRELKLGELAWQAAR